MGRILIVVEEKCGDCQYIMSETAYETDNLYADSSLNGSAVKRQTKLSRCKKCQPIFEEKMKQLKEAGLVQVFPLGVSGQKEEERRTTLRDFLGRDRNKRKKEAARGNSH